MDTSTISPHPLNAEQLPGYGLPLDAYVAEKKYGDDEKGFTHPLLSHLGVGPILPVREYAMMEFIDRVTDKEKWEEKVWDEEIVGKWKGETVGKEELDFSEGMFEWVSPFSGFPRFALFDLPCPCTSYFLTFLCVHIGNIRFRITTLEEYQQASRCHPVQFSGTVADQTGSLGSI